MSRRYVPPREVEHDCPTKAEHDAKVAATGRPYTQPDWDKLPRAYTRPEPQHDK